MGEFVVVVFVGVVLGFGVGLGCVFLGFGVGGFVVWGFCLCVFGLI